MMKKTIITLTVIGVLTLANTSQALVVSDPGAYARFAQQIQQLQQETSILTETFKNQQEILKSVTGNLKRGAGIERGLMDLINMAKKSTTSIHNLPSMDMEKMDFKDVTSIQRVLDKLYSKDDDVFKKNENLKYREFYKQRTMKSALENSEFLISQQQQSLTKIQDLASKVDQTKDLKDSADLGNRLLSEILMVEQQQLLLLAQLTRAEQAQKFGGVDSTAADDLKTEGAGGFDFGTYLTKGKPLDVKEAPKLTKEECDLFGGCN